MKKITSIISLIAIIFSNFVFPNLSFAATSSVFGTTGMSPWGITMDSAGNVYTVNSGDNTVTKVTPAGVTSVFGTTGMSPWGITMDSAGNIYTANYSDNTVTKITPTGVSSVFGTTGTNPDSITIDGSGNIYTANRGANNVTKITPDGTSTILGTTGSQPFGIAIDGLGNIYTANFFGKSVTKITPTGVSSLFATSAGLLNSIKIDSSNNVYVLSINLRNITKITPDGTSTVVGTTGMNPYGIAIDGSGNIYTANSTSNNVTMITPDGTSTILGTTGTVPRDITIDGLGNIYTANSTSNNVTKITAYDITPPIVNLVGSGNITINQLSPYVDSGAYWTDNIDGSGSMLDSTFKMNVMLSSGVNTGSIDTSHLDNYTITYTKTDSSGNSGSVSRSVDIKGYWTTGDVPVGIVVDSSGNIYTSDSVGQNVTKITPDGTSQILSKVGEWSAYSPLYGVTPEGLILDSSGNIYTANWASSTVTKITPDGTYMILGVTGAQPRAITIDGSGNIYTANSQANTVTKITPAGVSSIFGTTGTGASAITIDGSGNIYTANSVSNNVTKITPTGVSSIFGTTGTDPIAITIDGSGNIYTANEISNNVTKITPDGTSTILGTTGMNPRGIVIDGSGNIYTANSQANTVTKITPAGVSSIFGTTGTGASAITIDGSGNIYTANSISNNVTKITPFDATPPVLTLSGSSTITLPFGTAYTELGARWTDNIDGTGILLTASSGTVNSNIAGTYTLTYHYTDKAGNTGTTTRAVIVQPYVAPSGGGGGGTYIPPVSSYVGATVTPPVYSTGIDTSKVSYSLLPTQSHASYLEQNTSNQNVYTIENRITDYICPKIVQVYGEDQLLAKDLGSSVFTDDMKSVIMYRALEKNEQTNGQTFLEYKRFGIAINDLEFEPNRNVTRAEYVKMLVRALSCRYSFEGKNTPFSDVESTKWYAEYINFATNHGWISGYGDSTFRPDAPITRAEAAKILANAIQLKKGSQISSFSDVPNNSVFTPYIEALKDNKVISGRTKTTYAPDAYIPRTEASRLVYRTFLGGNN